MRCTSYGSISCNLFTAELQGRFLGYDATCLCFQAVLQFQQTVVIAGFAHLVNFFYVLASQFVEHCFQTRIVQLVLHADHLCFREFASGHNVELTSGRLLVRIHFITQAGSSQRTFLVEEFRVELSR